MSRDFDGDTVEANLLAVEVLQVGVERGVVGQHPVPTQLHVFFPPFLRRRRQVGRRVAVTRTLEEEALLDRDGAAFAVREYRGA